MSDIDRKTVDGKHYRVRPYPSKGAITDPRWHWVAQDGSTLEMTEEETTAYSNRADGDRAITDD